MLIKRKYKEICGVVLNDKGYDYMWFLITHKRTSAVRDFLKHIATRNSEKCYEVSVLDVCEYAVAFIVHDDTLKPFEKVHLIHWWNALYEYHVYGYGELKDETGTNRPRH